MSVMDRLANLDGIRDAYPDIYRLSNALDQIGDPAIKLAAVGCYYKAMLDNGTVRHEDLMHTLDQLNRDADRREVNEYRSLREYVLNEVR